MRLIFLLSGEHPDLAREEVLGLLRSYGEVEEVDKDEQILVVDFEGDFNVLKRLALIHEASEYLGSCQVEELENLFKDIPILDGYICVRIRKIGKGKEHINSLELEKSLGAILWKRGAKISVSKPDKVIRVYISNKAYVGVVIHTTDKKQFIERRPDKRPFFMPFVVLPRLARALINITGVKGVMLDPMCGTGTFLIEAGLMGIDFVGVDAFKKIVFGCAKNLKYYGLAQNVIWGDARNLPFKDNSFDAIVTDFPYLRSTKSFGEDLYEKATAEIWRVLKPNCRAVLIINIDLDDIFGEYFKIEGKYYQRVHKSLMRRFFICRKDED